MSLMNSLNQTKIDRNELWIQLENQFHDNIKLIDEQKQMIPIDVISIYAYNFAVANKGSDKFWSEITKIMNQAIT